MAWNVQLSARVRRMRRKLPKGVEEIFQLLLAELELNGPAQPSWPHYSKLGPLRHHCHLKRGRPNYVAVWEVEDAAIRLMEVTYVGTHQGAPY